MSYDKNTTSKSLKSDKQLPSSVLQIGEWDIRYTEEGQGFPLVMIQGLSCSFDIWARWSERLRASHKVIRLELPVAGTERADAADYAFLFDQFLQRLNISRCHLLGSSFGGEIAIEYAHRFPHKVGKLVLAAPSGFTGETDHAIRAAAKSRRAGMDRNRATSLKPVENQNLHLFYHQSDLLMSELEKLKAKVTQPQSWVQRAGQFRHISELNHPTLLVWGENDRIVPVSDANKFRSFLTSARLIVYPKAGHFVFDEYAGKTCRDLANFLA